MKTLIAILMSALMSSSATIYSTPVTPIYMYQTVQENECVLAQTGANPGKTALSFKGRVREIDPQVYQCSIEIPKEEFEKKLGYCVLRGHNYSASYSFYKGKQEDRRHIMRCAPLSQ